VCIETDGKIDGFLEADKLAYKRFKARLKNLEVGELITFDVKLMRNSKYHRKFFLMLQVGFDAWEPARKNKTYKGMAVQKNFERFRKDVVIAAGHYEQTFNLKGEMELEAKSISFRRMEQPEFEEVYNSVLDVLLQEVLITYKGRDEVNEVVEQMMRFI